MVQQCPLGASEIVIICFRYSVTVAGKTQGHLRLILLLLFNLKHTRKELPLETAHITHDS